MLVVIVARARIEWSSPVDSEHVHHVGDEIYMTLCGSQGGKWILPFESWSTWKTRF